MPEVTQTRRNSLKKYTHKLAKLLEKRRIDAWFFDKRLGYWQLKVCCNEEYFPGKTTLLYDRADRGLIAKVR